MRIGQFFSRIKKNSFNQHSNNIRNRKPVTNRGKKFIALASLSTGLVSFMGLATGHLMPMRSQRLEPFRCSEKIGSKVEVNVAEDLSKFEYNKETESVRFKGKFLVQSDELGNHIVPFSQKVPKNWIQSAVSENQINTESFFRQGEVLSSKDFVKEINAKLNGGKIPNKYSWLSETTYPKNQAVQNIIACSIAMQKQNKELSNKAISYIDSRTGVNIQPEINKTKWIPLEQKIAQEFKVMQESIKFETCKSGGHITFHLNHNEISNKIYPKLPVNFEKCLQSSLAKNIAQSVIAKALINSAEYNNRTDDPGRILMYNSLTRNTSALPLPVLTEETLTTIKKSTDAIVPNSIDKLLVSEVNDQINPGITHKRYTRNKVNCNNSYGVGIETMRKLGPEFEKQANSMQEQVDSCIAQSLDEHYQQKQVKYRLVNGVMQIIGLKTQSV
ncbi:MAG: hypothetical protein QNJ31_07290 [Candidatus Caenarcaniphilales bacterium]|nr:hypothetical protein [Candidatus Caenarcaniphilales bacterium]